MKIILYFLRTNICNYGLSQETHDAQKTRTQEKGRNREKSDQKSKKTVFAKRVKAVVSKLSETKVANYAILNRGIVAVASADWDGGVFNLMPQDAGGSMTTVTVAQGDRQNERDGNQIRVVSV